MSITNKRKIIKALCIYHIHHKHQQDNQKTPDYIRKINISRPIDGEFHLLVKELREMDQELFFKYFRMNSQRFDQLLLLIKSKIDHNYTHQIPISAAERLAITLRILATGDS